ncbi:hypothetical protein BC826DRAFT_1058078, partial [Russula brevipes]
HPDRVRRISLLRFPGSVLPATPLMHVPFPHLTHLHLESSNIMSSDIPHSGYISPEAMVTCLSQLTKLRILCLSFQSPRSRPDQPSPPPPTRASSPQMRSRVRGRLPRQVRCTPALSPWMEFRFGLIELYLQSTRLSGPMLGIECDRMDVQVSTMARACRQISPLLSDVERLDLIDACDHLDMQRTADVGPAQFLELFRPFTAVRRLYLSK